MNDYSGLVEWHKVLGKQKPHHPNTSTPPQLNHLRQDPKPGKLRVLDRKNIFLLQLGIYTLSPKILPARCLGQQVGAGAASNGSGQTGTEWFSAEAILPMSGFGKQCVKLVGLRHLSPDSGSFGPYAQKWKSPQVTDGSVNSCCMHCRYQILDVCGFSMMKYLLCFN